MSSLLQRPAAPLTMGSAARLRSRRTFTTGTDGSHVTFGTAGRPRLPATHKALTGSPNTWLLADSTPPAVTVLQLDARGQAADLWPGADRRAREREQRP